MGSLSLCPGVGACTGSTSGDAKCNSAALVACHGQPRDLLRADGLGKKTDCGDWILTLGSVLGGRKNGLPSPNQKRAPEYAGNPRRLASASQQRTGRCLA